MYIWHLMTSDDICGHLFGYESPSPYFRIKSKKGKTYGICVYRGQDIHGNERGPGSHRQIDNQEACTLMDVSPRKMLQLRRSGSIPYSYIDRKVYYKRQDIIRFMEAEIHRVTPLNRMIWSNPCWPRKARKSYAFSGILRACPKYWTHRRKRCGRVQDNR